MSKNGPDGTTFSLDKAVLDQDHNILFGLAILPSCEIVDVVSHITTRPPGGGDAKRIHTCYVGVNGGPEEAKKRVCELIDQMWKM